MRSCMCTNGCKKCGACCQDGCSCSTELFEITTAPYTTFTTGNEEASTCPTCRGSGKVRPG